MTAGVQQRGQAASAWLEGAAPAVRRCRRRSLCGLGWLLRRTVHLMLAEGTVPMYYQGVKYNIPVVRCC